MTKAKPLERFVLPSVASYIKVYGVPPKGHYTFSRSLNPVTSKATPNPPMKAAAMSSVRNAATIPPKANIDPDMINGLCITSSFLIDS